MPNSQVENQENKSDKHTNQKPVALSFFFQSVVLTCEFYKTNDGNRSLREEKYNAHIDCCASKEHRANILKTNEPEKQTQYNNNK